MAEILDRAVDFVMRLITENGEDRWGPISVGACFFDGRDRWAIETCSKPKSLLGRRGTDVAGVCLTDSPPN
jgi:hypothetical protein